MELVKAVAALATCVLVVLAPEEVLPDSIRWVIFAAVGAFAGVLMTHRSEDDEEAEYAAHVQPCFHSCLGEAVTKFNAVQQPVSHYTVNAQRTATTLDAKHFHPYKRKKSPMYNKSKVVLQEGVKDVGIAGDVVDVRSGYYLNYLHPRGKALIATEEVLKDAEELIAKAKEQRAKMEEERRALLVVLNALADDIDDYGGRVVIEARASPEGTLFGAVSQKDVLQAVSEQALGGKEVSGVVKMDEIKNTGTFEAKLVLDAEVVVLLKVQVVALE